MRPRSAGGNRDGVQSGRQIGAPSTRSTPTSYGVEEAIARRRYLESQGLESDVLRAVVPASRVVASSPSSAGLLQHRPPRSVLSQMSESGDRVYADAQPPVGACVPLLHSARRAPTAVFDAHARRVQRKLDAHARAAARTSSVGSAAAPAGASDVGVSLNGSSLWSDKAAVVAAHDGSVAASARHRPTATPTVHPRSVPVRREVAECAFARPAGETGMPDESAIISPRADGSKLLDETDCGPADVTYPAPQPARGPEVRNTSNLSGDDFADTSEAPGQQSVPECGWNPATDRGASGLRGAGTAYGDPLAGWTVAERRMHLRQVARVRSRLARAVSAASPAASPPRQGQGNKSETTVCDPFESARRRVELVRALRLQRLLNRTVPGATESAEQRRRAEWLSRGLTCSGSSSKSHRAGPTTTDTTVREDMGPEEAWGVRPRPSSAKLLRSLQQIQSHGAAAAVASVSPFDAARGVSAVYVAAPPNDATTTASPTTASARHTPQLDMSAFMPRTTTLPFSHSMGGEVGAGGPHHRASTPASRPQSAPIVRGMRPTGAESGRRSGGATLGDVLLEVRGKNEAASLAASVAGAEPPRPASAAVARRDSHPSLAVAGDEKFTDSVHGLPRGAAKRRPQSAPSTRNESPVHAARTDRTGVGAAHVSREVSRTGTEPAEADQVAGTASRAARGAHRKVRQLGVPVPFVLFVPVNTELSVAAQDEAAAAIQPCGPLYPNERAGLEANNRGTLAAPAGPEKRDNRPLRSIRADANTEYIPRARNPLIRALRRDDGRCARTPGVSTSTPAATQVGASSTGDGSRGPSAPDTLASEQTPETVQESAALEMTMATRRQLVNESLRHIHALSDDLMQALGGAAPLV